jgi:transposase-like protein
MVVGVDREQQAQLARELVEQARVDGLSLVGSDGLLTGLTKTVLETALEAEMDDHLGYPAGDRTAKDTVNERNGKRAKTLVT